MKILTKKIVWAICCLSIISSSLFSSNITILESQSIHPLHKMDENWKNISTNIGHSATIVSQTFLDDYSNLSNTDVLIISSGLIDIPDNRKANILQFVQNGGNVYLQSEYLADLPGNATFKYVANNLGNSFEWEEEVTGNLNPMAVIGDLSEGLADSNITYYWYGTSGSGDANFIPFLKKDNKDWGFIYCPSNFTYGKIITTSDQDWIRTSNNDALMGNIINRLAVNNTLAVLPTVSIEMTSSPCDDTYAFTATINNNTAGIVLEWLVNGQVITGENGLTYASNSLLDGDVVECRIAMASFCATYEHVSNPILIAPMFPTASPEITISIDNTSLCEGQIATFTTAVTQTEDLISIAYQWLVNGTPVVGATAEDFSSDLLNDQDLISCQITYDDACNTGLEVLSNEIEILVSPMFDPSVSISANTTEICFGETITFTATGNDLGSNSIYQWQIDGVNVGTNDPTFSSTNITNGQNVNCLITTQYLCSTTNEANSNTISIIVNEVVNPSIEITTSTNAICSGESVTITANASDFGTNPTFQWQIDGLNVGTNLSEFSTTDLEDGQQITCILSVVESCATSAVVTSEPILFSVTEGSVPTLSIISDVNVVCNGQSATFTASGENHGQNPVFEWFVNGVSMNNNSAEFTLENINEGQEVTCSVINNEACPVNNMAQSNTVSINISNIEIEVLELMAEHCDNADGLIEVLADGGNAPYTYEWSNGQNSSVMTNLTAGNYEVLVMDANGCSETISIALSNNEGPQIAELIVNAVDCSGDNGSAEIVLESASDETTFEWINDQGTVIGTSAKVENLLPGFYEIAVTNEYGCEVFETINIAENSPLAVAVNDDLRLDLGASIQLEASVFNNQNVTYEWFPAEGLSCTDCANPVASPVRDIVYEVIVTNELGCTATNEVFVHLIPKDDIFVPNAFSPNGDGVNDFFTVFAGDNVAQIKTLRVFDRWGAEVFGNQEFSPNVEPEGWNGTFKGKVMKSGVYVYYVEVEYIDGSTKIKKGDLSIIL